VKPIPLIRIITDNIKAVYSRQRFFGILDVFLSDSAQKGIFWIKRWYKASDLRVFNPHYLVFEIKNDYGISKTVHPYQALTFF